MHLALGTLSVDDASRILTAEIEAVRQLETEHAVMRDTLETITNHHLAGASLYAYADILLRGNQAKAVDGGNPQPSPDPAVG